MGVFTKMMQALSGQAEAKHAVRDALTAAFRDRTKIALEIDTGHQPVIMTTSLEQIREDDLAVSQPMVGGQTYQLAFGEELKLSFVNNGGFYTGQTRCLGRVKIPAGNPEHDERDQMIFAYRLALPESLGADDRRRAARVRLGFKKPIEAQLYAPASTAGPVLGTLVDVSLTGARIDTPASIGRITPGQALFLKTLLPDPVGLMDELVDVVRVDVDIRSGQHIIGLRFRKRINGMEDLIRRAHATVPGPR